MPPFRFEPGQRARVVTHPARAAGVITARRTAEEMADVHGENVYAVSVFVTKQRESSLEPVAEADAAPAREAPAD